jgi:SAM-dependent methyltransferase
VSVFKRHLDKLLPAGHSDNMAIDTSETALDADVEYANKIVQAYLEIFERIGVSPVGKDILELGPGKNFGSTLIFGCLGARVAVSDLYLSSWDAEYHPLFYRRLLEALPANFPKADRAPLRQIVELGAYPERVLRTYRRKAENLSGIDSKSYDVVISNAVLEHVEDPRSAAREMMRVTRPGGFGIHQIDFRDHRDFSKPLEYLLWSRTEFTRHFAYAHGSCGNRWRQSDFINVFNEAGFAIDLCEPNVFATDEYLADLIPRLGPATQMFSRLDLHVLSGRFVLRRPIEDRRAFLNTAPWDPQTAYVKNRRKLKQKLRTLLGSSPSTQA